MNKLKAAFVILFIVSAVCFPQTHKIKIIETSDVHGMVLPFDFTNNREANFSLAHFSTFLNKERADTNQTVLLLDNGDILQGTPLVYYYNFERTDIPHVYAQVMNYLDYDAATIGNHDIETGHDVYDKFRTEIDFPWLAANAVNVSDGEPYFQPYKIIMAEEIKIAVLGLITPAIPNWLPEKIWEGMRFEDMIETARKWIAVIEEKESPDIVIGLFHAGFDYTYGGQSENSYLNENASQLVAKQVPGFDIIFIGHDHETRDTVLTNIAGDNVYMLGPTSQARNAAVAEVNLSFDKQNMKWDKEIDGYIVNLTEFEPDENFLERFDFAFDETKEYVSKKIGTFSSSIPASESLFGDAAFTDLIHTTQLELTGADVSFTAPLSINTSIDTGDIFVKDMFKLYRYENLLYTMELSGSEIKDYIEYSYSLWFNQMKSGDDNLLLFETDESGKLIYSERSNSPMLKERYYNFDSAEGIEYMVDVSKPAGDRIKILGFTNGNEFNLSSKYKVAVNSYRGNGSGGHLTRGAGIDKEELSKRIINATEKDLRFYMMKWIEGQGVVNPTATNNWEVTPNDWWMKAKKKDYKLMFN
ncbi:MAG: 5'-nucleotidase C-terminal domain-containing protein [Melioribacteraceae bacterium]|nr:5'-nucleotidase C-terminal domain-containing protein [Melioribacteraceae bacterium]MCF8356738.1 5'-nucleotidase C-terminal domain-containing protein [Melioribacteraceae bacterium]MCF8395961.1 5'-nucleotidase C-terminal domain-containing protein [Melioribacteraceae bacterium]MCF8419524.1 5'-nucleotidase C-terminal domain-containing protein [Melioribacteraceae bacterium]